MDPKTIFAFLFTLIFPVLLLVLSEDLLWPAGWIFSLWFTLLCFSTILYLYKKETRPFLRSGTRNPVPVTRRGGTGTWSTAS